MKDMILTVNIPFCESICSFCTKNVGVSPKAKRDAYYDALLRELASVSDELSDCRLRSLYFTGGIPTILAQRQLPELAHRIQSMAELSDDFEFTVATNPGCLGINVLSRLKDYRLSRVEFSLCSVDPLEQDILERRFGEGEMYVSRQILEFGKADVFSVDILRGQPGQRKANMRSLLESAFMFAPPAVSMYPLRYSEATRLHALLSYREGKTIPNVFYRSLPDKETQLETFRLAEELLAAEGFAPYTVYHYAKPGFESLHHTLVRTDIDRIELGLGGVTISDGMYIRNTDDLDTYIQYAGDPSKTLAEVRALSAEERMRSHVTGQLGLLRDFSEAECTERFGCAPDRAALEAMGERGYLQEHDGRWSLTASGKCFPAETFAALWE